MPRRQGIYKFTFLKQMKLIQFSNPQQLCDSTPPLLRGGVGEADGGVAWGGFYLTPNCPYTELTLN